MFPEQSGAYIAQRDDDIFVVKVKGVYPSFQLDKRILDLGLFLSTGKIKEMPEGIAENILLFHEKWTFHPLNFLKFNVFSNTEFRKDCNQLYLSVEDYYQIRGKYYRLVEQGVSFIQIVKALSYEFKVPREQIVNLINGYDSSKIC